MEKRASLRRLGVKIKMVGTGASTPSLARGAPCSLVCTAWGTILIDVGPSAVGRLLELGYGVNDIDAVVLTHFHPDHTVDLTTLLFICEHGEEKREKPLLLLGGKGISSFFRKLSLAYPWIVPTRYRLSVRIAPARGLRLGPVSLLAAPMSHREESIAIRIEEGGKKVVFSGDTAYCPGLVGLAKGVDLLVAECTFVEAEKEGHLTMAGLLRVVREAKPKRVIMYHLSPEWERFHGAIPSPLLLGEDGMGLDL